MLYKWRSRSIITKQKYSTTLDKQPQIQNYLWENMVIIAIHALLAIYIYIGMKQARPRALDPQCCHSNWGGSYRSGWPGLNTRVCRENIWCVCVCGGGEDDYIIFVSQYQECLYIAQLQWILLLSNVGVRMHVTITCTRHNIVTPKINVLEYAEY